MKTSTWKLLRTGLLASACVTPFPALADQSMTYTVKTVVVSAKPTAQGPKSLSQSNGKGALIPLSVAPGAGQLKTTSETTTLDRKILLGKDQVIVESKENKTIIDFAKKSIWTIDPIKHEYTDTDLFSHVYFRAAESQNRKMLNSITTAAGIKKLFDSFDTAMLFALVVPGSHESNVVKTEQNNGKITYVHNGTTVAAYEPSKTALLDSGKPGFTRFLAHNCSLHPEIRNSLRSQKMLPETLTFHFKDSKFSTTDCSYSLKSSDDGAVENYAPPADYKKIEDKELANIYAALTKLGPDPKLPEESSVSAAVDVDLANKNPINALLTVVDYSLSSGNQRPEDMSRIVAKSYGNPEFALFFKNLEPHSAAEAKTAVKALESINRTKLSKGYVLNIMEANIYIQLKDFPKAKKLLTEALVANPLNVGAYHDLGNLFLAMWDPVSAWECFRIARKINPKHFIMKDIDEMEHNLQRDFPDFF